MWWATITMRTQWSRFFALTTKISQDLSSNTLILFATAVPLINLNSWYISWSLSLMHGSGTYCKAAAFPYSQLQGCNSLSLRSPLASLSIQFKRFQTFSRQCFKGEEVHLSIMKRLNSQCGRELNKDKKRAIWWGKQASKGREAEDPLATVSRSN